jgi:hypothetical protein
MPWLLLRFCSVSVLAPFDLIIKKQFPSTTSVRRATSCTNSQTLGFLSAAAEAGKRAADLLFLGTGLAFGWSTFLAANASRMCVSTMPDDVSPWEE